MYFSPAELENRNNWIDQIAQLFCFLGIAVPMLFYSDEIYKNNPWPLGLGVGLMVILPVSFVSVVTFPKGFNRFIEFWDFYEKKYNIGMGGVIAIYTPMACLGFFSVFKLL